MYQLHYYPGKANLAPHMLLEELQVPYELVLVDFLLNEHKSAAYLQLNPSGRLPALTDGDVVLFETSAICLYLVEQHPAVGLAPAVGSPERAHFYKWMSYLSSTLQPEIITYFYSQRLADDSAGAEIVKRHAEQRIGAMLDLIDTALAKSGGPYLLGAHYSVVDIYLLMLARWTRNQANPARTRPALGRHLAIIAERPAVQRAFAMEGIAAPFF